MIEYEALAIESKSEISFVRDCPVESYVGKSKIGTVVFIRQIPKVDLAQLFEVFLCKKVSFKQCFGTSRDERETILIAAGIHTVCRRGIEEYKSRQMTKLSSQIHRKRKACHGLQGMGSKRLHKSFPIEEAADWDHLQ